MDCENVKTYHRILNCKSFDPSQDDLKTVRESGWLFLYCFFMSKTLKELWHLIDILGMNPEKFLK